MKIHQRVFLVISIIILMSGQVSMVEAHDLWITMDQYSLSNNTATDGTVFSSHQFPAPADDALAPERLDAVFFITPSAQRIPASAKSAGGYGATAPFKEKGTCVAVALPVNGFATKTPDGYQRGKSKKDVKNSVLCRYSQKFAKAVFSVGNAGGNAYSQTLGHAMEIIPLKDPVQLKTGDILPVKVLLEGKPARIYVFGTYAGFSELANTFAYTTRTDKKGIAEIKLIHDGVWLLIAKQEETYPNAAECDKQTWAASLTFEIK